MAAADRIDITMSEKKIHTRIALLEQSTTHIQQSLDRIERRFDTLDKKIDNLDSKSDSNLKWMLGVYFGGFGSLFTILAHIQGWF